MMATLRENVSRPAAQLSLFGASDPRRTAYMEHRTRNPEVWARLVTMARQLKRDGWDRCSFRMLWELVRHELGPAIQKDATGFALNDHLAPYYARALMQACPDLRGMFETRGRV